MWRKISRAADGLTFSRAATRSSGAKGQSTRSFVLFVLIGVLLLSTTLAATAGIEYGAADALLCFAGAGALFVIMLPILVHNRYEIFEPITFVILAVSVGVTLKAPYVVFGQADQFARGYVLLGLCHQRSGRGSTAGVAQVSMMSSETLAARTVRQPRATYLPFHIPRIGEQEIAAVVDTLRSGWITTGPKVKQFEAAFASVVGARHAIGVNSCTAALHLALEAIGLQAGDEVIVPTMTFAATAEVVRYFDAIPVLVDCDPVHLNMDVRLLERAITPRTRAVIPVHFAGQPCDMDVIQEIAGRYGLRVIDDAAHSFPASYRGRPVGVLAEVTCFSFYATKTITTGEGGMITTDDDALAARMRMMSLHGISQDAWKRYSGQGTWYYEIESPGFKYNLTDIAAALGLAQLERHRELFEARVHLKQQYERLLRDTPAVTLPSSAPDVVHAWHLYVVQLELDRLSIGRARFIKLLRERNIGSSVHFIPLHLHPYYRRQYGLTPDHYPVASAVYQRTVSLPLFPGMTPRDVEDVAYAVNDIIQAHRR